MGVFKQNFYGNILLFMDLARVCSWKETNILSDSHRWRLSTFSLWIVLRISRELHTAANLFLLLSGNRHVVSTPHQLMTRLKCNLRLFTLVCKFMNFLNHKNLQAIFRKKQGWVGGRSKMTSNIKNGIESLGLCNTTDNKYYLFKHFVTMNPRLIV